MLAQDRYKKIIDLLERNHSVKVSDLTQLFGVSIETVRRDLEYLEAEGCLKRVYGGAVLEKINIKAPVLNIRKYENIEEKQEIANIAMRYITNGQSIALNEGTTTFEIARAIKNNFQKLTIVTNSISIAAELSDMNKFTVILCGGIYKSDEFCLVGDLAQDNISKFHIDTTFIGVSGISLEAGFTDYRFDEIQIQKRMIESSNKAILITTSNKFEKSALMKVCDLDKAEIVITDSKLEPCLLDKYKKHGVTIVNK
ncbi:DeoR/GlpR family DNA-binding transcription regulator [Clostridium rhizosphaerae]|uniref:DeoR/GlpR family DNA-binding transcription regulator n=1 Tax=Clostridium rhizosphaerae TaxID=2803861 RepID=UPI00192AEB6A|nr:DeoR/GlpR family DNA-binding transcription regulator [Clostridium rhizosphaerae]